MLYQNDVLRLEERRAARNRQRMQEIIDSIHEENAEVYILRYLEGWIINDWAREVDWAKELRATINAVSKIAKDNTDSKVALETIINLTEFDDD